MGKLFEKFWSGSVSFTAHENFKDLDSAVQASVPSTAAEIIIDDKTISYEFNRIKEVKTDGDNTLPTPGEKDPGKGKREKVSERKNSETKEKK
jgi:hypothetical protein